jgi:hypothetical protein
MWHDVVRRIESLALVRVGDDRDRAIVLVPNDAPGQVLARELAALEVERVAVAVVRRHAEHLHASVVLEPPQLPIVRDVAPDEIAPLPAPRRAFRPERTRPQPLDRCVALPVAVEQRIDRDHVGIDVRARVCVRRPVARRARDRARRLGRFAGRWRLRPHENRSECRNSRERANRADEFSPRDDATPVHGGPPRPKRRVRSSLLCGATEKTVSGGSKEPQVI